MREKDIEITTEDKEIQLDYKKEIKKRNGWHDNANTTFRNHWNTSRTDINLSK